MWTANWSKTAKPIGTIEAEGPMTPALKQEAKEMRLLVGFSRDQGGTTFGRDSALATALMQRGWSKSQAWRFVTDIERLSVPLPAHPLKVLRDATGGAMAVTASVGVGDDAVLIWNKWFLEISSVESYANGFWMN